jgi:glycosyltransferase involved in cell wall biosynthesis
MHWGDAGPALSTLKSQDFNCPVSACHDHTEDRVRWILARLREDPPDIFVPNLVVAGYFAARWARSAGIPTVGILHSDDAFYRGIQSEFVFGLQPYQLSALVCVSQELKKQVLNGRPQRTMVRRIPYGVSVPQRKVEHSSSVLRLVFVGRFAEEQKRISEVTRSLCRVLKDVPGTETVLYGDGPDKNSVENILATDGKNLPIKIGGRIDNSRIQERLLDCDVFIMLSDYEGLPISVMEAMSCGCVPVCLGMRSGIPELVEDGVTGLLVNDRADSFVQAIWRLKNESGLWEKLSRAARIKIEAQFSNRSSVKQWAELFYQLNHDSNNKRPINIPRRFWLPPVHPGLVSADPRPQSLPLHLRSYKRGRMAAGKIKRWLIEH